jgi:hypothetical protein
LGKKNSAGITCFINSGGRDSVSLAAAKRRHCRLSNGAIQCAACHHQTTVTAGTIMHRSHAALTKWFLVLYFVSQDKRGISAMQLCSVIGVTYKTAWYLLARIRKAMGQRDDKHRLSGLVELDDAFFGSQTSGKKRGAARNVYNPDSDCSAGSTSSSAMRRRLFWHLPWIAEKVSG